MPRWYLEVKQTFMSWWSLTHSPSASSAWFPCDQSVWKAAGACGFKRCPQMVSPSRCSKAAQFCHLAEHYTDDISTAAEALTSQWLLLANATLSIALFVPSVASAVSKLMAVLDQQLIPIVLWSVTAGGCRLCCTGPPGLFAAVLSRDGFIGLSSDSRGDSSHPCAPAYRQVMGMG